MGKFEEAVLRRSSFHIPGLTALAREPGSVWPHMLSGEIRCESFS
jgi:hypothetical protein